MLKEFHDESSDQGHDPASGRRKTFAPFALGLVLGLCLGLGGGVLWMSQRQDTRFVLFQAQTKMIFDLEAADLRATYGLADEARTSYQQLLELAPEWPDALERYAWFLHSQSAKALGSGQAAKALTDARECLAVAHRFYELDKSQPQAQRVLKFAHDQMGDLLSQGQADVKDEGVFGHRQQSLALAEGLHKADPKSATTARELSDSLCRMGEFLSQRDETGDGEAALQHFMRALEISGKLLAVNPESAQRVFEVIAAHQRLASFYLRHGDKAGEEKHSRACYEFLHEHVAKGGTVDHVLQQAYEELKARFCK